MMNCYLIIILNDVQVGAVGRFEGSVYCREGKRIVEVQSQWEMAEKQANGVVTATVGPVLRAYSGSCVEISQHIYLIRLQSVRTC